MTDSRLAFDIMARDDGASAVFDKVARSADRTGLALKKTGAISDAVAKSSANLTAVRNKETDALDKVQVAESKLSDARQAAQAKVAQVKAAEKDLLSVRNDTSSSTSQIAAAEAKLQNARNSSNTSNSRVLAGEKALAKARREAAAAGNEALKATKTLSHALDNEGKKAGGGWGKSFVAGIKKWVSPSALGDLKKSGQFGATAFGSGFLGVLKTPVLGPAVVATVAAAVAVAMPAVGAIAAGALVAGFGAGLVVLGSVFAAKSVAVRNAWNRSLWAMSADMKILSKPFERTLIDMAAFARRTFVKLTPALSDAFKLLGPSMSQFGDDLGRAFEKLAPAIRPVSVAFAAVLKSLGPAMQSAMGSFAHGLQTISDSVGRNPDGLSDLVRGTGKLFDTISNGLALLNDLNTAFKVLPGGTSAVTRTMNTLSLAVNALLFPFAELEFALQSVNALSHSMDLKPEGFAAAQQAANDTVKNLQGVRDSAYGASRGLGGVAAAAGKSAHETHAANVAAYLLATAFERQAAATQKANDLLYRRSNLLLSLSGAEIDYQQAVDDVTAAIKENGRTHDITTQKGRDNQRALDQSAASANAQTTNLRNSNKASVAVAVAAQRAYAQQAVQMGYTAAEARRMAQEFIKIPPKVKADFQVDITDMTAKVATAKKQLADPHLSATKKAKLQADIVQWQAGIAAAKRSLAGLPPDKKAKLLADKADLDAKLAAAKRQLADPKLTATKKAKLEATITALEAAIRKAKAAIASVPGSKTVTITTRLVTERIARTVSGASGGHVPGEPRASGGPVKKGQPYWVGEKGPEPFIPDQSGTILPNSAVKKGGSSKVMGLSVAAGMAGGIQAGAGSAVSAAGDLAAAVIAKSKQVLGISSPSKVFTQLALYVGQGFSKGIHGSAASIQSAFSTLMNKVVSLGFDRAKQGRILRMLQMENKGLQALAIKRVGLVNQLKAAQDRLVAAVQVRDEFRKSITDSALAFNSITNISTDAGRSLVSADVLAHMRDTLQKTKQFASQLARLKGMGLRSDLYKQIAEAGVESGGATADALLQGGKGAITVANDLQRQIANASAGLGNTAAANMYQAGVDAAQGLVNGLLAKTKALDAASKKLAAAIVAQIKKTLGIRSPSKVLEWHGSMAGQGFSKGIEGEYGRVMKASAGLGNAATNVRSTPGRSGGAVSGQLPLKVELVFKSDGTAHMNYLVGEFRKYVQINGGDVQAVLGAR